MWCVRHASFTQCSTQICVCGHTVTVTAMSAVRPKCASATWLALVTWLVLLRCAVSRPTRHVWLLQARWAVSKAHRAVGRQLQQQQEATWNATERRSTEHCICKVPYRTRWDSVWVRGCMMQRLRAGTSMRHPCCMSIDMGQQIAAQHSNALMSSHSRKGSRPSLFSPVTEQQRSLKCHPFFAVVTASHQHRSCLQVRLPNLPPSTLTAPWDRPALAHRRHSTNLASAGVVSPPQPFHLLDHGRRLFFFHGPADEDECAWW